MIIQSTIDTLKAMRFSAMAGELEKQLNDPATYNSLGFEERLGLLIDAEWNRRQSNKLAKGIRDACFSAPDASVEGIEYHPDRKLDKAQMLRFATCMLTLQKSYTKGLLTLLTHRETSEAPAYFYRSCGRHP